MSIVDNTNEIGNGLREIEKAKACAISKLVPVEVPPEIAAAFDWTHELTDLWDFPGFEP